MITSFYTFIKKGCENKDALFVTTGLLLPVSIFCFRVFLWYKGLYILFPAICGYSVCNRILEPLFLLYLPTFIIFCYISRKDLLFYEYLYKRVPYLFNYFYVLPNLELYFYNNLYIGFIFYTILFLFYLFFLYTDNFLMHMRILLVVVYSSFRIVLSQNFVENNKTVLSNSTQLGVIKRIFQKEKVVNNQYLFALWYIVLFTIFYRLDLSMGEYIKVVENLCNECIEDIDSKIMNGTVLDDIIYYEQLKNEKENIFTSLKRKWVLYKASLYVFGFFQGNEFEKIYEKLQKINEYIG